MKYEVRTMKYEVMAAAQNFLLLSSYFYKDTTDETMLKLARKMKVKGYPVADIADITGLLEKKIEKL